MPRGGRCRPFIPGRTGAGTCPSRTPPGRKSCPGGRDSESIRATGAPPISIWGRRGRSRKKRSFCATSGTMWPCACATGPSPVRTCPWRPAWAAFCRTRAAMISKPFPKRACARNFIRPYAGTSPRWGPGRGRRSIPPWGTTRPAFSRRPGGRKRPSASTWGRVPRYRCFHPDWRRRPAGRSGPFRAAAACMCRRP